MWIPMEKAWQLNERHYGALQGLDKNETVAKHGKDQVHVWRRSYDIPPPPLEKNSPHYPGNDVRYGSLLQKETPVTESLKTTLERVVPFWNNHMLQDVLDGQNILVAAHGNSLRALVKELDNIPDDVITDLNIPTGACLSAPYNSCPRSDTRPAPSLTHPFAFHPPPPPPPDPPVPQARPWCMSWTRTSSRSSTPRPSRRSPATTWATRRPSARASWASRTRPSRRRAGPASLSRSRARTVWHVAGGVSSGEDGNGMGESPAWCRLCWPSDAGRQAGRRQRGGRQAVRGV